MALLAATVRLTVVVLALLVGALLTIVGSPTLREAAERWRPRARAIAPHAGLLAAVVGVRLAAAQLQVWVAWNVGFNITGLIYTLEGDFVALVQSIRSPGLTEYFVVIYLYGYVFLLAFPLLAYFCLDDDRPLATLLVAFAVNYGVGFLLYAVFVAFGPRNLLVAEQLLYTAYPQARSLTDTVNANVNVFPSLHASLSVTVALLAWRTRDRYPTWTPVALALAASVVVSTMYLGIHWATDVLAGSALAVWSVAVAGRIVQEHDLRLPTRADVSSLR